MAVNNRAWRPKAEDKAKSGGLTAKGRARYKQQTGGTLKAPIKGRPTTPEQQRRKGQFLSRMGGASGPERDSKGEATRLLKSLQAWGASSKADAKKKGRYYLDMYARSKKK